MVIENDSHTVKELVEIGMPEECAAILCKLPYDTFVFEINGDKYARKHLAFTAKPI